MLARILCLAFVLFVASVYATSSSHQSIPLFAWSPQNYFGGNLDVSNVALQDWNQLLSALLHNNKQHAQSSFVARHVAASSSIPASTPEVVLSFVYPKLSSNLIYENVGTYSATSPSSAHFDYVKRSVSGPGSSLWLPYVNVPAHHSVSADIVNSVVSHNRVASVINIDLASKGCDSAVKSLSSHATNFHNGITDAITIMVDENDSAKCMKQLIDIVAKGTDNHFIALLTSNTAANTITYDFSDVSATPISFVQQSSSSHRFSSMGASEGSTSIIAVDARYPGPLYISPAILLGVLVAIMLAFILYIGVSCLMSIERPVRMSTQPLILSKEY